MQEEHAQTKVPPVVLTGGTFTSGVRGLQEIEGGPYEASFWDCPAVVRREEVVGIIGGFQEGQLSVGEDRPPYRDEQLAGSWREKLDDEDGVLGGSVVGSVRHFLSLRLW